MTLFQSIKWTEKFGGKWVVSTSLGVSGTYDKKKKAKNEAFGEAQQVANKHKELVLTDVYTKKGIYQRTEKTYPTGGRN